LSIVLTINGTGYDYPETGDTEWGPEATDWAQAVTNGMLQKAGGLFQLLAEADFGSGFGLKSLYYKSRTANVADSGQIRLARADVINFRNQANSANLSLGVDASNNLTFEGAILASVSVSDTNSIDMTLSGSSISGDVNLSADTVTAGYALVTNTIEADGLKSELVIADTDTDGALSSTDWNTFNNKQGTVSVSDTATIDLTFAADTLTAAIVNGSITNAMINASAAIDYSKLNLSGSIVNADVNASAAIAYSKLNLLASIVNADIAVGAAIAYSKLSLTGSIVSADISGQISLAKGGTNKNMTAVAGGVVYTDADSMEVTAAGTSGQALLSNGSSAPSWSNIGTPALTMLTTSSGTKTPGGTGQYQSLSNNSVTLLAGKTYELTASVRFTNNGSVGYTLGGIGIMAANGGDSGASPAALSSVVTVNSVQSSPLGNNLTGYTTSFSGNEGGAFTSPIIVTVGGSNQTVYAVSYCEQTTTANARVITYLNARQLY
jgi:hypothetical protein